MSFLLKLFGGEAAALVLGPTVLVAAVVGWIAATLTGLLLAEGGLIAGAANYIQSFIVSPQNAIVTIGWTIVRDVANLGFVLVIIVIAFATILRLENYGAKKLLPRLILAAILVNFSLQIGAFIIGFSQVITDFFFSKISLSPGEIGATLIGAFGPQRFLSGAKDPDSSIAEGASIAINLAIGPWLATAFNLIMFFTILVLAFMLIIRFLALSFLLVIAPITWLFFVIPALQAQFSKWWNKFLQWTFFAPATSFFVYLSFTAAQGLGKLWEGAGNSTISSIDKIIQAMFMDGVNVILLSGFLIGGIIVAQHMGITGAAGAMGLAQKVGQGARKRAGAWAGRQAKRGGARALESKPATALVGAMQRIPGLRRMGMALGGRADIMRRELVVDADRRLAKYSDTHIAKNLDVLSAPEQVAAKERLAKNGTVGLIKDRKGNGNVLNNVTAKDKELFESYYGKDSRQWKAFEVAAGMDVASADAIRAGNEKQLKQKWAGWVEGLKPEQITKLPVNNIFNGKDKLSDMGIDDKDKTRMLREATIEGIGRKAPGDLAKLFNKVKPVGFESLYEAVDKFKEKLEDIYTDPKVGAPEQQAAKKKLDTVYRVLEHAPSLRFYSGMYEGGGAPPAAAPPPPPTPPRPRP